MTITASVRPLPLDDLRAQFLAVGFEKYQMLTVDGRLNRIADDQAVSGIAGTPSNTFTSGAIDNASNFHRVDGPAIAGAADQSLVGIDIDELAGLEVMLRCAQDCRESPNQCNNHQRFARLDCHESSLRLPINQ